MFAFNFSDYGHLIPDDGFEHTEQMSCPCNPYVKTVPGIGSAVVHPRMSVPDTIPKEWTR